MLPHSEKKYKIIVFDGVCNFCNYWVNFILVRDRKDLFRFTALQSEKGQKLLSQFNLPQNAFDSFILISENEISKKSTAVFNIASLLGGWISIICIFRILPVSFTDFFYDMIAKNRYKIFGKRNSCRIPNEEEISKFL